MDALSTYISFIDRAGARVGYEFQNFHAEQARTYEGLDYLWAAFGYTGAAVDIQAANVDASLVFTVTDLMLAFAQQAADNEWLVRVWTVWLDPETLDETSDRLEEVYAITSWSHNRTELTLRLASPLDAQAAEIPSRVLSRKLVGSLPPSGTIAFV